MRKRRWLPAWLRPHQVHILRTEGNRAWYGPGAFDWLAFDTPIAKIGDIQGLPVVLTASGRAFVVFSHEQTHVPVVFDEIVWRT